MIREGFKIDDKGYSLKVTKVKSFVELGGIKVYEVHYIFLKGLQELSHGFVYISDKENAQNKLKEVLDNHIRALSNIEKSLG